MAERYEELRIPPGLEGSITTFSEYRGTRVYRQHNHRELELNIVQQGHLDYIIRGQKYTLKKGSLLWLFPGQRHGAARFSEDFDMIIAVFRPPLVERVCVREDHPLLAHDPPSVLFRTLETGEQRHLVRLFTGLKEESEERELFNAGLGYCLLKGWQLFQDASRSREVQKIHPAVTRMIQLMASPRPETPLPELAGEAGLSYSRLSRVFREQTGQSITTFRDRMQVELFCELIQKNPYRTIEDCALEAGFGSYAQFFRVFKKYTGRSPGEYRKNR